MKPHKWAKEIKAWADGAEIEQRYIGSATATYKDYIDWHKTNQPNWDMPSWEYRIKPQPKEPQPHRLLWGGGVEPIIEKPHEVSEQYGKAMQQAYEDGFVQGKIYAETGRVSDGKTIPKEPQYLYLFGEVGGTISYRKERHGFQYMGTYIGKIKLETEDE